MKDYNEHLEKLIADIRKKVFEEEELKESFKTINNNYEQIIQQLEQLTLILKEQKTAPSIQIINNSKFIDLMGISQKTAQTWRDTKIIGYSMIGNKIYYRVSDIKELLNKYHNEPKEKKLIDE